MYVAFLCLSVLYVTMIFEWYIIVKGNITYIDINQLIGKYQPKGMGQYFLTLTRFGNIFHIWESEGCTPDARCPHLPWATSFFWGMRSQNRRPWRGSPGAISSKPSSLEVFRLGIPMANPQPGMERPENGEAAPASLITRSVVSCALLRPPSIVRFSAWLHLFWLLLVVGGVPMFSIVDPALDSSFQWSASRMIHCDHTYHSP